MSDRPPFDPDGPAMTPAERRRLFGGSRTPQKRGYAGLPGKGPPGETCGSCAFILRKRMAKTYLKCALFPRPTGGPATDILASTAACQHWAAPGSAKAKAKGAA